MNKSMVPIMIVLVYAYETLKYVNNKEKGEARKRRQSGRRLEREREGEMYAGKRR